MILKQKYFVLFFGIISIIGFLIILIKRQEFGKTKTPFSVFYTQGAAGEIRDITICGSRIYATFSQPALAKQGEHAKGMIVVVPPGANLTDTIMEWKRFGKIETFNVEESNSSFLIGITVLFTLLGTAGAILLGPLRGKLANPMSLGAFGKVNLRRHTIMDLSVTFDDVAGCEEAKAELQEIVLFLRSPEKFRKLGGVMPKGVLLSGPPGTGKTLLAKAVAGEAGVQFFTSSGSDFVEMYVGVGASRVRDLFAQAKRNTPCIIFVDEIDAVGRHRGSGPGHGGNSEREQTLNQLLVEMDGFEGKEGIILIAATNRVDVLDPALLRPGRFDRRIVVGLPDAAGRSRILRVHTEGKIPLAADLDIVEVGKWTAGFSGADLKNLCNEAALHAATSGKESVDMQSFAYAKEKVFLGAERRITLTDEAKRTIAFHEAGHAVVAMSIPDLDPVYKVSIIPRGKSIGVTWQLPSDKISATKQYYEGEMAMLLGGRAAEEMFLKAVTTGASNDLDRATRIARRMVCEYGMSEKVGPLVYSRGDSEMFPTGHRPECSEATAQLIDQEIKDIVLCGYVRAKAILGEKSGAVITLANALMERETVDADEVIRIMSEPREGC